MRWRELTRENGWSPVDDPYEDSCLCEIGLCSGCDHFDCHLE
ncbi:MAG TPA: hypothetical protein VEM95_02045 [Thermoplasmata archaeon]|nr:hypothetical protein [Thermoplasmata archaeon]